MIWIFSNNDIIFSIDVDYFPKSDIGVIRILKNLNDYNKKGTFFLTGLFAKMYPKIIKQIIDSGHEIGCHGYSHGLDWNEDFSKLSFFEQNLRIEKANRIIMNISGISPNIFRAPYLKINQHTLKALKKNKYHIDSSYASFRFDFGFGVSNDIKNLFISLKPKEIFIDKFNKIFEIPSTNFILPYNYSTYRIFGENLFSLLNNIICNLYYAPVFIIHPWEVMTNDEIQINNLPIRHKKNRGREIPKCIISIIKNRNLRSFTSYCR